MTASVQGARPAAVVLVGAHGHGHWHLDNLRRLGAEGAARLVGICDRTPPGAEQLDGFAADLVLGPDLAEVLERCNPDVTVICTPIHTHAELAALAMRAHSHVLLEKPPAPTYAEHDRIAQVARETGMACQIGFQDLGSTALPEIRRLLEGGAIGELKGIGGACAWVRPTSYFSRAAWSGKRVLDGVPVVDGALTNPFAHAVASALALAGVRSRDDIADVEVELFRANDIEADDTSCVRVRTQAGPRVAIGATLCAAAHHEPYLVLHGSRGRISLEYKTGLVSVEAVGLRWRRQFERRDLLENLLAHTSCGAEELLAPIDSLGGFMQVVEAVRTAPEPTPITGVRISDPDAHVVVPGAEAAVTQVCEQLATFSELGLGWARRPGCRPLTSLAVRDSEVATYADGSSLEQALSPRPYLHPVRTLAGIPVTDARPADHRWHLGAGVAVQDVAGWNLWGGRTYVEGRGYSWRDDHGSIRHRSWKHRDGSSFDEELDWCDGSGAVLLHERREVTAEPGGTHESWRLSLRSSVSNPGPSPVQLGSPGSHGRVGGGYGGFFWRLPPVQDLRVFTPDAEGEDAVHGSRSPWVATNGTSPGGATWSLVFQPADERSAQDPWFVRASGYPGVGSSLAWEDPVSVEPGESVGMAFHVWVVDGNLKDEAAVNALVQQPTGAREADEEAHT